MRDYDRALPVILEAEGGYYDGSQPWDVNPTMRGITQETYDAYRDRKGLSRQPVHLIGDVEVSDIYQSEYWTPAHADALPWPLSLFAFDTAVNEGIAEAIKALQRTANRCLSISPLDDDGVWGSATSAAIAGGFPVLAFRTYLLERVFEYGAIVQANPVKATPLYREWIPRVQNLYRRFT